MPNSATHSSGTYRKAKVNTGLADLQQVEVTDKPAAKEPLTKGVPALDYYRALKNELSREEIAMLQMQQLDQPDLDAQTAAFRWKLLTASQLVVPESELRGNEAVTKDTKRMAKVTASILTGSSLIDFVSSIGLFGFIFAGATGGGLLYALPLSVLFMALGNQAGRAMCNRLPGARKTANIALVLFLALSIVQSVTSGLGVFLFNGAERVNEGKAALLTRELIASKTKVVKDLENPNNPIVASAKAECDRLKDDLKSVPETSGLYQQLSVAAFGSWAERNQSPPAWVAQNRPISSWPACPQYGKQLKIRNGKLASARKELSTLEKQIGASPSKLTYIQANQPEIFVEHFRVDDGEIVMKNGAAAFGAAWNFFWNPGAASGEMTLSYLYAVLSFTTSAGAIALLIAHSQRRQTMMSYCEDCGSVRSQLHQKFKREAMAAFSDSPLELGKDDGISLKQYRGDASLPRRDLMLRNVWEKGDKDAHRQADLQYISSTFELIDLSPAHHGLIINNQILNSCDKELDSVLKANKKTVVNRNV